ncbi:MAG: glycoside hydrolase family 3 protein [Cyclobacteriaceae bacterium]|nr:glycoside hydrolase family 3 protein [Cyclobacteriaceae bacterium]
MPNMFIKVVIACVLLACSTKGENTGAKSTGFSLDDFFSQNEKLSARVDSVFQQLDSKARIAQMIVVAAGNNGKPTRQVEELIKAKLIGGVLLLGGEMTQLPDVRRHLDSLAHQHGLVPLLYSADAEPSLINRKLKGTQEVPKTIDLNTEARCDSVAAIISGQLLEMGIRHNYAPVVDMSVSNEAITNRSFGSDPQKVVALSATFIKTSQSLGVVATAKHFPGHGLVSGDTHHNLVTIDGEMKEVENYMPLIKQGVLSIMVGHIAVVNNKRHTNGLPASCSRVIVTDLLKKEMGFDGLVITDAMNMGAVQQIEHAAFKAVEAGCDLILMEPDEYQLMADIYEKYNTNRAFQEQIDLSVKKILRLKACLNMI